MYQHKARPLGFKGEINQFSEEQEQLWNRGLSGNSSSVGGTAQFSRKSASCCPPAPQARGGLAHGLALSSVQFLQKSPGLAQTP